MGNIEKITIITDRINNMYSMIEWLDNNPDDTSNLNGKMSVQEQKERYLLKINALQVFLNSLQNEALTNQG